MIPDPQPSWECKYCTWFDYCVNAGNDSNEMPHEIAEDLERLPPL
jgi:hypothetical protein